MNRSQTPSGISVITPDDVRDVYDLLVQLQRNGIFSSTMGDWTRATGDKVNAILHSLHPQFAVDHYPTIEAKAARVLVGFTLGHPLVDGNKRLAVFSMHRQLLVNGYELEVEDHELIEITHKIVSSRHDDQLRHEKITSVIADWIATVIKLR